MDAHDLNVTSSLDGDLWSSWNINGFMASSIKFEVKDLLDEETPSKKSTNVTTIVLVWDWFNT